MELGQIHNDMKNLNEAIPEGEDIMLYMNTWGNYNENGADADQIGGGWKSLDDALEFWNTMNDKGEEPFINDVDDNVGLPFEIGENSYVPDVIENIKEYMELMENDQKAIKAMIEADGIDYDEAKSILDKGDFVFYEDVHDVYSLAEAEIYNIGTIEDAVGRDNLSSYVDTNAIQENWYDDVREYYIETMQDDDPDFTDDDIMEDEFDEYFDRYIQDYIDMACEDPQSYKDFWEQYFDYESYGQDLSYDFTITEYGAIYIY